MIESFDAAASENVLDAVAKHLLAGDIPAAIAAAEQEYSSQHTAGSICAMAVIAFRQGNLADAIRLLEPMADGVTGKSDIPEALAVLNCLVGRVSEALFYGKLAAVIPPDQQFLPLFGPAFPRFTDAFLQVEHKPLLTHSRDAFVKGLLPQALDAVEQHLKLFRNDVEALDHYAQCLMVVGRHRSAVGTLRSVLTLGGPSATLYGALGQALVALGEFDQGMACHRQAVTRGPKAVMLWAAMLRDWAYSPWGDSQAWRDAASGFGAALAATAPKVTRPAPAAADKPVLVVGFLCNVTRDVAQRAMISHIARGFNRDRVRVVGFGPGDLESTANDAYRGNFDVWRKTDKVDELTLSALIRGEGVDVLIDADGLSARERLGLLARNPAPLRLSWLNMPLGTLLPGAQAHLGDESGPANGAWLLNGPENDVVLAPERDADRPPTFGADVTLAELNSEVVRLWSAILHQVPDATLVLADHDFSDPESGARLVEMFGDFGVAHRIDVIKVDTPAALFAEVDVALAPFPMVRPPAYGVALAQGVPVVVSSRECVGFARSLRRLGPEGEALVAANAEDYVARAVALVSDWDALEGRRHRLRDALLASSLATAAAFSAEWERFFRTRLAALETGECA